VFANILRSHHFLASIVHGNRRTINSAAKSRRLHTIEPRVDVSLLRRQHSPAFFLIQKNDGARRETFARCTRSSRIRIRTAKTRSRSLRLELSARPSIEEHKIAKSVPCQHASLAQPRIAFRAGRIVQPVTRKRKRAPQHRQRVITRIIIAIETKYRMRDRGQKACGLRKFRTRAIQPDRHAYNRNSEANKHDSRNLFFYFRELHRRTVKPVHYTLRKF
jgi:hypothetical protein